MAGDLPPSAGSVSADILATLLDLQGERDWLDYKRQCDLSSARGLVEFAKDVGAMMITGGYIVVGADDNGQPTGDVDHLELFDPATLHAKLAKYLGRPFEIRSATHDYHGQSYALVYAVPHLDGFCVFERDGSYQDGKGQITVFRAGDVFARHGTRSERWNQRDIPMIKQRLQADADRTRDQHAEALSLLRGVPPQLGGSGLWLAMAVVPEYRVADAPFLSPDAAQQFLRDWQLAQVPIEGFSQGTATYRQPGGVVITNQSAHRDPPHWWRLGLYDAGEAVGAHVLTHEIARNPLTDDRQWYGLPEVVHDGLTIPARRDQVEIHLLTLLDVLTDHAARVGAGGTTLIMVSLLAPSSRSWSSVALVNELVDDSGQRQGWRLASARSHQVLDAAVGVPAACRVRLSDMRNPSARLRAAYRLTAELLAIFGIDQPSMLTAEGAVNPDGVAIDHDQLVFQHARHLGLPIDPVSPAERRQRYENKIRAAKEELRQR